MAHTMLIHETQLTQDQPTFSRRSRAFSETIKRDMRVRARACVRQRVKYFYDFNYNRNNDNGFSFHGKTEN